MIKTIIILIILSFDSVSAQVSQEWVAKYKDSTTGFIYPVSISTDELGNSYVTGTSNALPRSRIITFKYSSQGILQWYRIYETISGSSNRAIKNAIDAENNLYIIGLSQQELDKNLILLKYNSNGDSIWVRNYTKLSLLPRDMVIDKFSNVYITLKTEQVGVNYYTMKYDSSGNLKWSSTYNYGDYPAAIAVDSMQNVIVTGNGVGVGFYYNYITVKYDSMGNLKWARNHYSDRDAEGESVACSLNGDVYVTGYTTLSNGNSNYSTLKYDSSGKLLWNREYDRVTSKGTYKILVDSSSNCFVIGSSAIIKYDLKGNMLWLDTSSTLYYGVFSILDNLGCLYITKITSLNGSSNYFTTQKYGTNGNIIWVSNYGGELNHIHEPHGITIDKDNNIVATGFEFLNGTKFSDTLITIKYSQTTGIINYNSYKSDYKLFQNYPNPFNPITKIRYQIGNNSYVRLKIFDIEGKDIKTLVKKYQNTGSYIVQFDGNDLSSGIYFYSLYINNELIETKKLMLIK